MQTSLSPQSAQKVRQPEQNHDSRRAADRVYQGVTIAVMLLLLVSLWAF